MPVVRIAALAQADAVDVGAVLVAVSTELAALLGEDERGTWATWEELPPRLYAEGRVAPAVQPRDTHPPLVDVIAYEGRPPELVAAMLETVAAVLVRELGLGEGNVFVRYVEAASGRLFTGGAVVGG